jgi:predicted metalloprotease with PDZ domain
MRHMYQEYYKKKNRGFTEAEFQEGATKIAGTDMSEFFDHVNTVREIDFTKFLGYAGLKLSEDSRQLPDPYVGLTVREKNDSLFISKAEWQSPAWEASLRASQVILTINGQKATKENYNTALKADAKLQLTVLIAGQPKEVTLQPARKTERAFTLTEAANPTTLQQRILKGWLAGKE